MNLLCFLLGHKPYFVSSEDERVYIARRCERCGCKLGIPEWTLAPPMPKQICKASVIITLATPIRNSENDLINIIECDEVFQDEISGPFLGYKIGDKALYIPFNNVLGCMPKNVVDNGESSEANETTDERIIPHVPPEDRTNLSETEREEINQQFKQYYGRGAMGLFSSTHNIKPNETGR